MMEHGCSGSVPYCRTPKIDRKTLIHEIWMDPRGGTRWLGRDWTEKLKLIRVTLWPTEDRNSMPG